MRSLSARMLLAALGTLLEDAVAALERGGTHEASAYLDRLSRKVGFTYDLTDAHGRDVLSGADRSALLGRSQFDRPPRVDGRIVLTESMASSS